MVVGIICCIPLISQTLRTSDLRFAHGMRRVVAGENALIPRPASDVD